MVYNAFSNWLFSTKLLKGSLCEIKRLARDFKIVLIVSF